MKSYIIVFALFIISLNVTAQGPNISQSAEPDPPRFSPAMVDFDAFEKLTAVVKLHRQSRLIPLDSFLKLSREKNVVILDTRSDSMYKAKHVKGAIHLDFSDFTQANLKKLIPDPTTRILIYCNNNFDNNLIDIRKFGDYFPTKSASVPLSQIITKVKRSGTKLPVVEKPDPVTETQPLKSEPLVENVLTLALNIPTYINLYGYGYKNVYELSELVRLYDPRIQFEGTSVLK